MNHKTLTIKDEGSVSDALILKCDTNHTDYFKFWEGKISHNPVNVFGKMYFVHSIDHIGMNEVEIILEEEGTAKRL